MWSHTDYSVRLRSIFTDFHAQNRGCEKHCVQGVSVALLPHDACSSSERASTLIRDVQPHHFSAPSQPPLTLFRDASQSLNNSIIIISCGGRLTRSHHHIHNRPCRPYYSSTLFATNTSLFGAYYYYI